jgi:cyclopropane-fatty-acyl-phospholipid synthase
MKTELKSAPRNNSGFSTNNEATDTEQSTYQSSDQSTAAIPKAFGTSFDSWLLEKIFYGIGAPPITISLWNGLQISARNASSVAVAHIKNRKTLLQVTLYPNLYFGEAYGRGDIEIDGDLVQFLETVYRSLFRVSQPNILNRMMEWWFAQPQVNTLTGSKKNIHHHYNIGNEFYKLWLDKEMQYTCAYFPTPAATLEEAQQAKMEHVCRKAQLKPGMEVVEAGCGWGSLALYMAEHFGVKVKAYNISHEQIKFARQRALDKGLQSRVEFIEDDYRNVTGEYDAFISVGMLEHVGVEHYRQMGKVIERSLKETGYGVLHFIGRNQPSLMNAWIEKHIFPGGYPPSLRESLDIFESINFSVTDIENLRLHYAKTLEYWLSRYEHHTDKVNEMFDEEFVNVWRLYLAGSVAAFYSGELQLFQIAFTHPDNNRVPWTRDFLYSEQANAQENRWKHVTS